MKAITKKKDDLNPYNRRNNIKRRNEMRKLFIWLGWLGWFRQQNDVKNEREEIRKKSAYNGNN